MSSASGALLALLAVVVAAAAWTWLRAPRRGKEFTPITDGWDSPIQFLPGPPLLPDHDA
jgi:hypothetical protein